MKSGARVTTAASRHGARPVRADGDVDALGCRATPRGGFRAETTFATVTVRGSIAGQRSVAPVRHPHDVWPAAIPVGPRPTGTTSDDGSVRGSIFETVPSRDSRPRPRPSPTATAVGRRRRRSPSRSRPDAGRERRRSPTTEGTRSRRDRSRPRSQRAPAAAGNVPVTRPDPGSIRETVPSVEFVTQTAPSPEATPVGPLPTVIVCRDPVRLSGRCARRCRRARWRPRRRLADGDARRSCRRPGSSAGRRSSTGRRG